MKYHSTSASISTTSISTTTLLLPILLALVSSSNASSGRADLSLYVSDFNKWVSDNVQVAQAYLNNPTFSINIRTCAGAAFGAMVIGNKNTSYSQELLDIVFAAQNLNTSSPVYGNIVPYLGPGVNLQDPAAIDEISFSMILVSSLLATYSNSFPQSYLDKIRPNLIAAGDALITDATISVPIYYTNVALMNMISLIQLGEYLQNDTFSNYGYNRLNQWYNWTSSVGITEYLSSTYYAIDITPLLMGYLTVQQQTAKDIIKRGLDMLVFDSTASYFPSVKTIAGPQSRSYVFLNASSTLNAYLYAWGVRDTYFIIPRSDVSLTLPGMLYSMLVNSSGYFPDSSIISSASVSQREVTTTWGPSLGMDRYFYITPGWAAGSSSCDYGPQDKTTDIRISSGNSNSPYSEMFVSVDNLDNPYGTTLTTDSDGFSKPSHLNNKPVIVQQRGIMLGTFVATNTGGYPTSVVGSLATNIIFPTNANNYTLNGTNLDISQFMSPTNRTLNVGEFVSFMGQNVWVGARILYTESCSGQSPQIVIKSDTSGIPYSSARIAIYHHTDPSTPTPPTCACKSIILLLVEDANSPEDVMRLENIISSALISKNSFDNSTMAWEVDVTINGTLFSVGRYINHSPGVVYRRVNGIDLTFGSYTLNGNDIGKALLSGNIPSSSSTTSSTISTSSSSSSSSSTTPSSPTTSTSSLTTGTHVNSAPIVGVRIGVVFVILVALIL